MANPLNAGPYRAPPTPVQNSRGTSNAKAYYSINHIADRDGKSVHDLGKIEHSKRTGGAFELLYPARLYRVARERYYVGYSEEYSIKVFDKQGRLVRIVRREVQPVPVSRQEEDEAREVRRRLVPPQAIYDMEQVPFLEPSEHHPFFSEILVDASEHLWVREYRKREDGLYRSVPQAVEGGQAQKFNIFDTAGLWLGSVDLPNQLQVTDIGTNYILGIWRDSDLVESIRIYALDRRRDSR